MTCTGQKSIFTESTIFFAVKLEPIRKLPFPAVTICAPTDGKWMALSKGMTNLDTDQMFQLVKNLPTEYKSKIINSLWTYAKILIEQHHIQRTNEDYFIDRKSLSYTFGQFTAGLGKSKYYNGKIRHIHISDVIYISTR
jgi:hypothetical protein